MTVIEKLSFEDLPCFYATEIHRILFIILIFFFFLSEEGCNYGPLGNVYSIEYSKKEMGYYIIMIQRGVSELLYFCL